MSPLAARLTASTLLLLAAASPALAQDRPIELGVDGSIAVSLDEPRVTVIAIPFQQFRVGFFMSPRTSIEPTLSINHVDTEDVDGFDFDVTTISIGVGVLFHMTTDRTRSQIYFRPFGGFTSVSALGESESDPTLGLGLGLKAPLANRLATRLEAFLANQFADDNTTSVGVLFGLSFFTR